jgi:hypothetical protein
MLTSFSANGRLEYYAVLFISILFPLPFHSSWQEPNSLSAAQLPHRTTTTHQIAGIFSWTVNSAFIHEDGKL